MEIYNPVIRCRWSQNLRTIAGFVFYDMAKLEATDGFILHGWMVTELGLTGFELIAYALVHQFSMKSKAGLYTGGVPYLANWLSCSNNTARKYLHSLEAKGLVKAESGRRDGVPYCYYQVIDNHIPKILRDTHKKFEDNPPKIEGRTPKNFGVDNNIDNKRNNNIPPTPQEVAAYARSRGFADPEGFADYYIEINNNRGWRMKSGKEITNWKNNIVSAWEKNHKDHIFRTPQPQAQAPTFNDFVNSLQ